jgi:hypothetical protein
MTTPHTPDRDRPTPLPSDRPQRPTRPDPDDDDPVPDHPIAEPPRAEPKRHS